MTVCRVTIYGTYGGQGHINVLHFQLTDATTALINVLGQRVDDFWVDAIRGGVDGNMRWNRIHVKPLTGSTPEYDYGSTRVGALSPSTQYCPFICACFLFHTSIGGRRGRGRSFQGGYGHGSFFNTGQWQTATQNRIDDAATALTGYWCNPSDTNTSGWKLRVGPRSATLDADYHIVNTITGRNIVSTMNTRKLGRGL